MSTGVVDTTRAGLAAAVVVDGVTGEAEVLPRAGAAAQPARVVFGPAAPTPAELALLPRRRQESGVDLPVRVLTSSRKERPMTDPGVSVAFATVPTTAAPLAGAPWSGDVAAPAPRSPASVVIGPPPALPGSTLTPRPTGGPPLAIRGMSGRPSLPSRLLELLRLGHTRACGLTAQDKRILAYFAIALIVAAGGQVDVTAPAPVEAPVAVPAGAHVPATTQVLDLARAQIGTVEAPDGSTPYHRDYGLPADQPWCAVFVRDVFQDAGAADSIGPKTAFTPTLASWFRNRGQWSGTPTVGALVFYDWPGDSVARIQHVGIVESFTPTTITTIEGNTSNSDAGSQDDGDGVWRRTRPRNASIIGYGLPTYGLAP